MAASVILLTGGSGRLGRELLKLAPGIIAPVHASLNVTNYNDCFWHVQNTKPDIVIHAAALPSVIECEKSRLVADLINVAGTINMVTAAASIGARFVFVSTEYVFDGHRGNYGENAMPFPINHYGQTKADAERYALQYEKTLVVRAPFREGPPWPYPRAFSDQWTSSRFPVEVAPDVLEAALHPIRGILHLGGSRIRMIDLARRASPEVGEMTLEEFRASSGILLPYDCSLNSQRWADAFRAGYRPELLT